MSVRTIVVGLDGSTDASRALRWAIDLAAALDAEVVAVHALGLLDQVRGSEGSDRSHGADGAGADGVVADFERRWCAPLADAAVRSRRVVRDGPPVDVVLAVSDGCGADLVVVGSRGVGNSPARALGSTSQRLVVESRCPVVVLPPEDAG